MEAPDLTPEQEEFIIQRTVPKEIMAIDIPDEDFDIILKGIEVAAIFSLGQMHKKMVRVLDALSDDRFIGVLFIEHINDRDDFDFSKPDDWTDIELNSISISVKSANFWGSSSKTYSSIFQIKEVCRLREQL